MRAAAAVLCLSAVGGCGGGGEGLKDPEIGKARSFELAGFQPSAPVKAGASTTLRFHITEPDGRPLTRYQRGSGPHTGVHVILVREDLSRMIHRHPPVAADGTVTQEVTFPLPGPWHVLVDAYPDLGPNTLRNFQLTGAVAVAGAYRPRPLPAFRATQTIAGDRFALALPSKLRPLRPQYFDVAVSDAAGRPARFSTWYGATAHAIFFKKGTLDYFHTHVCRPEARACTSALAGSTVVGKAQKPGRLTVGTLLPTGGTWRLFLQSKVNGKVVTAPYTLKVA